MRRKGLVCVVIGLIVVPPAIYLSSQARADPECAAGEYVCIDGDSEIYRTDTLWIQSGTNRGIQVEGTGTGAGSAPISAFQSSSAASLNHTGYFQNLGTGDTQKFALFGYASGDSGTKYGVYGDAVGTGTNYAILGVASGGTENWAGYFYAGDVGVAGGTLDVGSANTYSAYILNSGTAEANKYAVYSYAYGDNGTKHGLYGRASGTGTNYGVYGTASGGTTNYAGYFAGDVVATGDITAGSSSDFRYASARTFYYSVPAAVCVDNSSTTSIQMSRTNGYAYIYSGDSGYLNCPVNIPDGATVTNLSCRLYDAHADKYVQVYLYRMRLDGTGSKDEMALAETTAAYNSGSTLPEDSTISYADINKFSYSYYLQAYLVGSGASDLRFHMCRIAYTMQDVKP